MDILVAHDYRTGIHYAREFGMAKGSHRPAIVTQAFQLRGFAPPTTFVYVNSDNGEPDPDVIEELLILESLGCEVDWVGIEPREELVRARDRKAADEYLRKMGRILPDGTDFDIWKYLN